MKILFSLQIIFSFHLVAAQVHIYDKNRLPKPEFNFKNTDSILSVKVKKATAFFSNYYKWNVPKEGYIPEKDYVFKDGKLLRILHLNDKNLVTSITNFKYTYNNIDTISEQLINSNYRYLWVFKDGNLVYELWCYESGKIDNEWYHEYKNNKLVSSIKKDGKGDIVFKFENEYDSLGQLKLCKEYRGSELIYMEEQSFNQIFNKNEINYFLFNNRHMSHLQYNIKKDTMVNYDFGEILYTNGYILGTFKISYDQNNHITEALAFDRKGKIFSHYIQEYDNYGRLTKVESTIDRKKRYTKLYAYDKAGNLIEFQNFTYNIFNSKRLIYKEINYYNDSGNILRKEVFDETLKCYDYFYEMLK